MWIESILVAALTIGCAKVAPVAPSPSPQPTAVSSAETADLQAEVSDAPGVNNQCISEETQYSVLHSEHLAALHLTGYQDGNKAWHKCEQDFEAEMRRGADVEYATYGAVICHAKLFTAYYEDKYRDHPNRRPGNCVHVRCAGLTGEEKRECTGEGKTEKEKLAPTEIAPPKLREMAAYQRYLVRVAESENRANIEYRLARAFYEACYFAEAAVLFKDIARRYPTEELAVYSVDLFLDSIWGLSIAHEEIKPACEKYAAKIVSRLWEADSVLRNRIRKENPYLSDRIQELLELAE